MDQTVCRKSELCQLYWLLIMPISQVTMNWSWRLLEIRFVKAIRNTHQNGLYVFSLVQLKVNQAQNSPTLDSEDQGILWKHIDKYIDQNSLKKIHKNDLVKEKWSRQGLRQWTESVFTLCFFCIFLFLLIAGCFAWIRNKLEVLII